MWGYKRWLTLAKMANCYKFLAFKAKFAEPQEKIWNASRICMSSLCRGHANLTKPINTSLIPYSKPWSCDLVGIRWVAAKSLVKGHHRRILHTKMADKLSDWNFHCYRGCSKSNNWTCKIFETFDKYDHHFVNTLFKDKLSPKTLISLRPSHCLSIFTCNLGRHGCEATKDG